VGIWAKVKQVRSRAHTDAQASDPALEPLEIHASELLDENTCQKCAEIDGHDYETLAQARADYPEGGYKDCESESGCRGTLVVMYDA
jgi:NMD protein affecting ribosome stability and mRNA decay